MEEPSEITPAETTPGETIASTPTPDLAQPTPISLDLKTPTGHSQLFNLCSKRTIIQSSIDVKMEEAEHVLKYRKGPIA